ncbi:MAG: methyl-accepting chemotaxis protein [Hydrogenophaga sp.]|uniref:methyl-accepting chemotaxis protein n=1 Tax=Hydrogenophaga sp. TaxID=1904254 RepID=UPI003D9BE0FF
MKQPVRVRTQLLLLCAMFIALLATIGSLGLWQAMGQSQAMRSMYEDRVVPLRQIKVVSDMYAVNIVDTAHKFADGSLSAAQAKASVEQARSAIATEWKAYLATYLVPEEVVIVDRLKPLMATADATLPELMRLLDANDRAGVARFRESQMYPVFDPMQGVIGDLIGLQLKVSQSMYDASRAGVRRLVLGMVGATLAAAAMGLAISLWITWRLTHQLGAEPHEVRAAAEAVASGDLTQSITVRPGFESSVMASMQNMTRHLARIVTEVRHNADSVSTASGEIAQGTQDLSQRSEEQASALEETAASMEQISATVRHNADHAVQADTLARQAATDAAESGQLVARMAQTMQAIDAASNRITDIVGVIDSIAFQTNILALNAAVEAARAGEQGRGFSIVAGEVRMLAQRSADAAREVRSLIHSSHEQVEEGTELTTHAAASVQHSAAAIQRLSELMADISTSTREQTDGLEQINVAVSQMDQTTQQNAALVEESAAASASLRDQAERLVQAVAGFRLPG